MRVKRSKYVACLISDGLTPDLGSLLQGNIELKHQSMVIAASALSEAETLLTFERKVSVPKGIVHRHWRRAKVLGHLALGLVAYGLIEEMAHRLRLSFYQSRRQLIAGRLTLDLSPLMAG